VKNLGEGFGYLWQITILRSLLIVSFLLSLGIGLWNALLLPFAVRALHASEFVFGVQEALTSVGFVLGSLLMAKIADRLRDGQWVSLGILGVGILGAGYSQITSIPLAIGLVAMAGFLNAFLRIGQRLLIQRNTTREKRGRVASVFLVVANLLFTIGMAASGLADIFDVRLMMLLAGLVMIAGAVVSFVIPGLGQPAAHWRRSINLLRQVGSAPGLSAGRAATPADLEALAAHLPAFANLSLNDQQNWAGQAWVQEAVVGTAVVRHHQRSDDAYFVINGRVIAGREENGSYRALETLHAGDFFGEIAALTNAPRPADVVAEEAATLLQVPAKTLRQMMQIPELNRLFMSKMTERMVRMNMIDLNFGGSLDQQSLRELRTPAAQAA
ncbi:MAG: MFS transporter, partial [Anaerolineales bacterium]|nr:MFS transporter [Anaerolineales bacterium]